jgi:hypothetical protein
MKKIPVLLMVLMLFLIQGCAVYTPYGYGPNVSVGYPYPAQGYRPQYYGSYGNYGWGGHHGWGGGHGWNRGGHGGGGYHHH